MLKLNPMKHRSTTPVSHKGLATKSLLVATAVLTAIAVPIASMPKAKADVYDDKMNALRQEAAEYQAQANQLHKEANTLANKIKELNARKAQVQTQIDLSQAKYNKLKKQIKETEQKILDNQDALGETIADLYVDNAITPLEMLASSQNIGDYVDKQTYRSSIRDSLTQTIDTIKDLKARLEKSKKSVKEVLDKQTAQRNSLAAIESEQKQLLQETRGKEAAYQAQVAKTKAQLQAVRDRQRAYYQSILNSAGGGTSGVVGSFQYSNWSGNQGCAGGYPYCGAQDSMVDPWGLYNRECVSYVAWALENRFGKYVAPFNGRGNAMDWPYSAPAYSGATRVYNPKPGDAVILPADGNFAPIGHAMIVESVSGGTVHVSQYNFYGTGEYSTMDIQKSGVVFLRFHG